jgi:hypothetical protein
VGGEDDDDSVAADPFERAKAALRAAREARGAPEDEEEEEELPPHDPNDPLSRAQAALEAARRARESGGRIQRAREEKARAELEQLKGQREGRPAEAAEPKPGPTEEPTGGSSGTASPRKREL